MKREYGHLIYVSFLKPDLTCFTEEMYFFLFGKISSQSGHCVR